MQERERERDVPGENLKSERQFYSPKCVNWFYCDLPLILYSELLCSLSVFYFFLIIIFYVLCSNLFLNLFEINIHLKVCSLIPGVSLTDTRSTTDTWNHGYGQMLFSVDLEDFSTSRAKGTQLASIPVLHCVRLNSNTSKKCNFQFQGEARNGTYNAL